MEQPLTIIKRLSQELPEKDKVLAEKFITNREFNKLYEIVESDIYMVQQNKSSDNPKEKFANTDLDKLIDLRTTLDEYLSFIEPLEPIEYYD